jgi:HD-GYP domain-containing protein (c-di-GMP phosphodiesterase class II)
MRLSRGTRIRTLRNEAVKTYVYSLAALAVGASVVWVYLFGFAFGWTEFGVASVLFVVCAASKKFPLESDRATIEIVDVAILAALVLLGPLWAMAVGIPAMLYGEKLRTVFVAAADVIGILAAGFVFSLFTEPLLISSGLDPSFVYGTMLAGVVFYALDTLINSTLIKLKYGAGFAETLKDMFLPTVPSDIAAILAALGTAYVMVAFGPAAALVLFAGAAAALISLHLIHKYQRESVELKKENAELLASHVAFAAGIVASIGAKDGYTARLAAASSVFAGDVGKEFGLEAEKVEKLKVAALLQDVGMVGVPDEVLMSPPDKLNSVGRMALERHAVEGERILSGAPGFEEAAKWVRWCHEKVDGTGYPDRLKSAWIPFEARILAVATAYSASILETLHSPALAPHEARMELTSLSGRSLDPEVVKTLLRVLDREDGNYATAADDRFAFAAPTNADDESDSPPSLRIV